MIKAFGMSIVLFGLVAGMAHDGSAETVIYGQDRSGALFHLPRRLCVFGGQQLRFRADVRDSLGRRMNRPETMFLWRLTATNGKFQQWDASGWPLDLFRRGYEPGSIYVTMPYDLGYAGMISAVSYGEAPEWVDLVDARYSGACEWASGDFYVAGPWPPVAGVQSVDGAYPCLNQCTEDLRCSDACPAGSECRSSTGISGMPFWQITACRH